MILITSHIAFGIASRVVFHYFPRPERCSLHKASGMSTMSLAMARSKNSDNVLCSNCLYHSSHACMFSGERFTYNPLEGGIEDAYFGKLSNGWMIRELSLFFGWISGHFSIEISPKRPIRLLVKMVMITYGSGCV